MLFFMYDNFFKIKDRYRVLLQCLICLKFFVNKYIYIYFNKNPFKNSIQFKY